MSRSIGPKAECTLQAMGWITAHACLPASVGDTTAQPPAPTTASPTSPTPTSVQVDEEKGEGGDDTDSCDTVVVDNADGAPWFTVATQGQASWSVRDGRSKAYPAGGSFLSDQRLFKGQLSASFHGHLPGGVYRVETFYPTSTTRSERVMVTVEHAQGTTVVLVNQRHNDAPDGFVPLGVFAFAPGGGTVSINNTGTDADHKVVVDAVRFVCLGPLDASTMTTTTASPSTALPSTDLPSTASPKTASPTTASPTTASPTTASPTTASPKTASPTTASPTTASPTSASPTSASPSSASPTSASPTSASPSSSSPTSAASPSSPSFCDPLVDTVIVDNEDGAPRFTVTELGGASWSLRDDKPRAYPPDGSFLSDQRRFKGLLSAAFHGNLVAGLYRVEMYFHASATRSDRVMVTIADAWQPTVVLVNQKVNLAPDGFVYLGEFSFGDSQGTVAINNTGTADDDKVVVDAVRFVCLGPSRSSQSQPSVSLPATTPTTATTTTTPAATTTTPVVQSCEANTMVVVDDGDGAPTFTVAEEAGAEWKLRRDKQNGYPQGNGYFLSDQREFKGQLSATFHGWLALAGTYTVQLYYTASSTRSTTVPVTVQHVGGPTVVQVDQRVNTAPDGFVTLGSFVFAAGWANVTISNANTAVGDKVVVDALRFVCAPGAAALLEAASSLPPTDPDDADGDGIHDACDLCPVATAPEPAQAGRHRYRWLGGAQLTGTWGQQYRPLAFWGCSCAQVLEFFATGPHATRAFQRARYHEQGCTPRMIRLFYRLHDTARNSSPADTTAPDGRSCRLANE